MLTFLLRVFSEVYTIIADTSLYLFFGFLLAGLLHVYLPPHRVVKFFGKRDLRSVVNASLFGIPLPLCSCSALPTAISLRKSGASRGSIFSFLVSTPETSVPSIGISFALLDPIMAIFRPIAAFITAIFAGLGVNLAVNNNSDESNGTLESTDSSTGSLLESTAQKESDPEESHFQKIQRALRFSFVELLDDLAPWLVIGIFAAGLISAIVPESLFAGFLGSGIWPMLLMLVIGIPLYVCAEGSTPIAAALILKGLSPGAAFVFLLAGPATNISSLIVLSKYFSRKILAIYLAVIALMALIFGAALNLFYSFLDINVSATLGSASGILPDWLKVGAAVLLIGLLHFSLRKTGYYDKAWNRCRETIGCTGSRLIKALAIILFIVYIADGFFVVPAGSTGMIVTFGKVTSSDLEPGLHYRAPKPFAQTVIVKTDLVRSLEVGFRRELPGSSLRLVSSTGTVAITGEKIDILPSRDMPEESELLAGDENLIDIDLTVHYVVEDAYYVTYRVDDIERFLREMTTHHILNQISFRQVSDELTAERAEFEIGVREGLQKSLDEMGVGVRILRVNVVYGHPPDVVHSAFRDVASALEDKYRLINLAQTDSISIVKSARANVLKKIATARSDSAQYVSQALGESERFLAISDKTKRQRSKQQFRMNAEAAESTLVNLQKFLTLTDNAAALDLILLPEASGALDNLPPEVIERLKRAAGQ